MCANFLKCSLLAHKRIDLRLWAVLALGSLAFEPIQKQDEQGGSTSTPWQTECGVMGDGPELDTLRRAKADPKKEIQRLREEGIGTLEAARRTGIAQAVDKASMIHRGCNMEMKPAYLYMEFVLRKISDSVHDPNWQGSAYQKAIFTQNIRISFHAIDCFRSNSRAIFVN